VSSGDVPLCFVRNFLAELVPARLVVFIFFVMTKLVKASSAAELV